MPTAGLPGRYAAQARPRPVRHSIEPWLPPSQQVPMLEHPDCFEGPAGLPCALQFEVLEGVSVQARAVVMLGLRLANLRDDELARVLAAQANCLARGVWRLGAGADGELRLLSLQPFAVDGDVSGAIDAASLVAMSILRRVVDPSIAVAPD
jgi:hypothetical protein